MRLMPGSLRGQVLLAVMLALLVAQGVSAALLLRAAENRRDAAMLNAAALQLVRQEAPRTLDRASDRNRAMDRRRERRMRTLAPRLPRPLRLEWTERPVILPGEKRDAAREADLADLLASQGVPVAEVLVLTRPVATDPFVTSRPRMAQRMERESAGRRPMLVAALRREGASQWSVARIPRPVGDRAVTSTIVVQTMVLFVVLALALWLLLRRITRPLAELTRRTEAFAGTRQTGEPLAERGPDDVRRLIAAHNAMEARLAALLDEKDVMLGAIGHDLKTPLAALRVRIESVDDSTQRARMAGTIEDITRTLDDILMLARVGRPAGEREPTDLVALSAMVVSEFEDLGEPVNLVEGARVVAPAQDSWLRRALRNLVANAVRYGGAARVSVVSDGSHAVLRVDDDGPGIPADRIPAMLEPFARGEVSRNRQTGGTGLGLAIARAIAEQHGGELALSNRPDGGLRAEIRLPLG
ncbi:MAG: two-component sensor histidine kinase [Erythrobacter sp. 34-65-8]|nr:MAG: two-component sensor histidine kinase [Erythrobacter sp. 34-65-8]